MGQICMLERIPSLTFQEIITRDRIVGYIFPTVYSVFSLFFFFKVEYCVSSQCLTRTTFRCQTNSDIRFSPALLNCYGGKYRRNLLTFPETLKISCIWSFFIMMENITLILIQRFSADLSPRTTFMIYYGFLAALIHFYHGLWLPVRYLIISRDQYYVLWAERRQDKETEEVQSVRVEPRRDYCGEGRRGAGSSVTRFSYSRREPLSHTRLDFVSIEI